MFRQPPPDPPPTWKRPVYLIASSLLGLVLSLGLHAIIEQMYLGWVEANQATIVWTNVLDSCALPLWVQIILPVVGLAGGFIQGRIWWRWVYVYPVRAGK